MRPILKGATVVAMAAGMVLMGCEADTDVEAEGDDETVVAPADTVDPEVELEDLSAEYERAYSDRDAPALSALHSKEYLEISPAGEVTTRTQLDSVLRDTTATMGDLALETESMTVAESGDVAYGTGTATLRGTGPDGQTFTAESRWLAGFRKVGGEWKIDRLMTSTPTDAGAMSGPGGTGTAAPTDTTAGTPADTVASTM